MKRLWPAALCLLFAGCAMFDEYDSYYDGAVFEQPMPAQTAYMPTTPAINVGCNGCGAANQAAHQTGYQTGEPPTLKQTAEPPK